MKKEVLIFLLGVFFVSGVYAQEYYVSPIGSASWNACTNINTPCSLATANANVQAGDTVYLRGGEYIIGSRFKIDERGIQPINSGTKENPIIFRVYDDEVVNFVGRSDQGDYSIGIWLNGVSHIKVTGKSLGQFKMSKMRIGIQLGPLAAADPKGWTNSNEISYVHVSESYLNSSWNNNYQGSHIHKQSYYNHIHHCKFEKHGRLGSTGSGSSHGDLFSISHHSAETENERVRYNVLEDSEFFHGGHATLALAGEYNIVRNNYIHNEPWFEIKDNCDRELPDKCLYGYRNIESGGRPGYSGHYLVEGNRIGYAGENYYVPPPNYYYGGTAWTFRSGYNNVRYNSFFGNTNNVMHIQRSHGHDPASNNRIYHNTIVGNGFYQPRPGEWDMEYVAPIYLIHTDYWGGSDWSEIENNVIKNNLFYNNGNTQIDRWVWNGYGHHTNFENYLTHPDYANCILEPNFNAGTAYNQAENVDPLFVDLDLSDTSSWVLPNLNLQPNSPARDAATYLTKTANSGLNSITLIVEDVRFFQDGKLGIASGLDPSNWPDSVNIQADWIAIGSVDNVVEISSINYETNTITLVSPKTWNNNDPVWLYSKSDGERVLYGDAPDFGAYEFISEDYVSPIEPPQPLTGIITLQDMLNSYQDYRQEKITIETFLEMLGKWIVFK